MKKKLLQVDRLAARQAKYIFEIIRHLKDSGRVFNLSAAGARDLRLLQAATKTLQLDKMRFFRYF